jgi:hypothetical protein
MRKPVFRLVLSYPDFRVEIDGETVETIPADAPGRNARLAALASRIAAERARLVAVLPEAEVWRARVAGRPAASRLRAAAAAALGTERVVIVPGPTDPEGRGVAAMKRATLTQTLAFLSEAGLTVDAVTGDGRFPGFSEPPEFATGLRSLPLPLPLSVPSAPVAAGLATAAAMLAVLVLQPHSEPAARPSPAVAVAEIAPAMTETEPDRATVAEVLPPALPPRARPADFVALAPQIVLPAPSRETEARPVPQVAFAARNLPPEVQAATAGLRAAQPAARVAVLLENGSTPVPRNRPAAMSGSERQAALPTATDALPTPASLAPRPRPVGVSAPATAAEPEAPSDPVATAQVPNAGDGPRPRPAGMVSDDALAAAIGAAIADIQPAEPVRVAALAPETAALQALPSGTLVIPPPEPRRATAIVQPTRIVPPAPPPAQVRAPVQAAAVPRAPARAVVAPAPTRVVTAPAPTRVAVAPAPTRVVATPAPTRSVRAAPAPQPVRTTARQEPARPGSVTLIGVFGKADQRHALVRLGNGSTERVRAGDRIAGVQVAAIGADSVRLAGGGRDTVLRLPE